LDRRRGAPGSGHVQPSPARGASQDSDVQPRAEADPTSGDEGQDEPFDVAIVATKGRWLERRSLVVEVELTLPAALTLDQAAALTGSVEAAVLKAIPGARASGPRSAPVRPHLAWLTVSGRTTASTTTAVVAGREQDLTGGS
jgi:hypothetical protein